MRCFVAARPDEATRQRLARLAARLQASYPGSRRVRDDNIHLTLAFIGELEPTAARRAAHAIGALPLSPLTWRIDRIGRFARAGIVWAGSDTSPAAGWATQVRECLATLDIAFDRKPFVAHVTLLRDVAPQSPDPAHGEPIDPIEWRMDRAELLASTRGTTGALRYEAVPARGDAG